MSLLWQTLPLFAKSNEGTTQSLPGKTGKLSSSKPRKSSALSSASRSVRTQPQKLLGSIWDFIDRPSKKIDDVMAGKIALKDQDKSIQSACSLHIYRRAKEILNLKTKDERKLELENVPYLLRSEVEKEVRRLWNDKS